MIRSTLKKLLRRATDPPPVTSVTPVTRPPAPPPPPEDEEPLVEIEGPELRRRVDAGEPVVFLDIREPYEVAGGYVAGSILIPMNSVPARLAEIPRGKPLIVYCAAGVRSYGVAHWLREQGYDEAWSLVGGIHAWLEQGGELARPESG